MADDEKVAEEISSRGADWEVVSLTASTYAAAPGPKDLSADDESKDKHLNRDEGESSGALFMSSHFVFPPNEHENLPIELEFGEIHNENAGQEVRTAVDDDGGEHDKIYYEKVDKPDAGLQGPQLIEKGQSLPASDIESKEVIYSPGSDSECDEPSDHNLDSPPKYAKQDEEDKLPGHNLPCEAWWKRHASCLYHHAKEANTFWSVVVAAALVGLVILGQRWQRDKWQRDKWQLHQLKWRFSVSK